MDAHTKVRACGTIVFTLSFFVSFASLAADAASAPLTTTISIDRDLVVLLKGAIWAGGIFIAIFAFISVAFFGVDVRNARAALLDAQKDTRNRLDELKIDFEALKDLKDKIEQLGTQLEDVTETGPAADPTATSTAGAGSSSGKRSDTESTVRTNIDLIKEVIRDSAFEWTSIRTVMKRTGLPRDIVLEEIRRSPDITIGTGTSKDFIFKLKTFRK